jgi:hypothetical protein
VRYFPSHETLVAAYWAKLTRSFRAAYKRRGGRSARHDLPARRSQMRRAAPVLRKGERYAPRTRSRGYA